MQRLELGFCSDMCLFGHVGKAVESWEYITSVHGSDYKLGFCRTKACFSSFQYYQAIHVTADEKRHNVGPHMHIARPFMSIEASETTVSEMTAQSATTAQYRQPIADHHNQKSIAPIAIPVQYSTTNRTYRCLLFLPSFEQDPLSSPSPAHFRP